MWFKIYANKYGKDQLPLIGVPATVFVNVNSDMKLAENKKLALLQQLKELNSGEIALYTETDLLNVSASCLGNQEIISTMISPVSCGRVSPFKYSKRSIPFES